MINVKRMTLEKRQKKIYIYIKRKKGKKRVISFKEILNGGERRRRFKNYS